MRSYTKAHSLLKNRETGVKIANWFSDLIMNDTKLSKHVGGFMGIAFVAYILLQEVLAGNDEGALFIREVGDDETLDDDNLIIPFSYFMQLMCADEKLARRKSEQKDVREALKIANTYNLDKSIGGVIPLSIRPILQNTICEYAFNGKKVECVKFNYWDAIALNCYNLSVTKA